jgi:hypothetical protein
VCSCDMMITINNPIFRHTIVEHSLILR